MLCTSGALLAAQGPIEEGHELLSALPQGQENGDEGGGDGKDEAQDDLELEVAAAPDAGRQCEAGPDHLQHDERSQSAPPDLHSHPWISYIPHVCLLGISDNSCPGLMAETPIAAAMWGRGRAPPADERCQSYPDLHSHPCINAR